LEQSESGPSRKEERETHGGRKQRSKLSKGNKQHAAKGRGLEHTGRLGELTVASYMSRDLVHGIASLKMALGRVQGLLQPFTETEQHFLFLPVIWIKSLPVPLNLAPAPSFLAEQLPVVCCRSRCLPKALISERAIGGLK
jgi:hypothetical protein